ncbi:TetR/AcrR family transcriptional regulator [Streptomyces liangshanensis]|uniref:TetR/AcrR family transcriptional regulator n=1 Tax=Streptomyces liangshanensis TaxID=2717324 RepID=UPI003C798AEB
MYEDTVPPRQRRTDARRNRVKVLTAATDLYAARGLEVSLNEIARHAKVGIATLQRNFPQREDLVAEVFAPRVREYADAAEAAAENPDPWAAFRGYVELVCRMQCEDRGFAAVLNTSFPASAELEAERRRALRGFTRLVRRAKEAGVLRGDFSPHDLPLFLLANAGVVIGTGSNAAKASRRLTAFFLQSCALVDSEPLPAGPPARSLLRTLDPPLPPTPQ